MNLHDATFNTGAVVNVGDGSNEFTLHLLGGTDSFADGLAISTTGHLTGVGTIIGDVSNDGSIAPGNSPGTISITGDLTNTGALTFEIASLVSFDQINLTGTFDAGGVMSVTLNYGPAVGTTFDLMDFGSFVDSGYAFSFTNTDAAYWDTGAFATTGSITIIPEPGMMGVLALGMLSLAGRSRKPRR